MNKLLAACLSFVFLSFGQAQQPKIIEEIEGKVIGVHDGDTLKVLVGKSQLNVRLEAIDAPEIGQSFGTKAKTALSKLVMGKTVTVHKTGTDKYGRTLGFIQSDEVKVNAEMIKLGFAWHFKKYSDNKELAEIEIDARKSEVGIWAESDAISPWEYRARKKLPAEDREISPAPQADSKTMPTASEPKMTHWLNTSSKVRHNATCEHFKNTKNGRACSADEGKACSKCGG